MDVASLLTLLLLALALAVQPWSVLAAVLLCASEGGVAKTVAYVSGWVLALAAVAVTTIVLYPQQPKSASGAPWTSWVQTASGVALGGWLLLRSRKLVEAEHDERPSSSQPTSPQPRWMLRLDSMSPAPAFALGAFLPNYAIVVAAVGNIVQTGLPRAQAAAVLLLFIVVASAGVAAPLLVLLFRHEDAPSVYQTWRAWLVRHGQGLVTIVLTVVAVVLVTKGVVGLVS